MRLLIPKNGQRLSTDRIPKHMYQKKTFDPALLSAVWDLQYSENIRDSMGVTTTFSSSLRSQRDEKHQDHWRSS